MEGNRMKMREALESVRNWCLNRLGNASSQVTVEGLLSVVNAALAAPPRNCDVGTPEEQAMRFIDMCNKYKYYDYEYPCNKKCPLASLSITHGLPRCQAYWAQMPYAAEEGAEK